MSVTLRDAKRSEEDQLWIQSVYPEYLDELAEVSRSGTGVFPVFGEHGARHAELLARWFRDDRSHPLLILSAGRAAGFALVSRPMGGASLADAADFRMAEFFIRRPQRRRGVGRAAASLIFSRFAGRWEIVEAAANEEAVRFWRRTVMQYTRGRYDERVRDGEVHQRFQSSNSPGLGRG
ncbi:MAG: GNAT family N-acetyltransferase [Proteobacteria bacterium]|nr:GNAT family N-acetyltransferase [Pseudomonadota bacterium]